MRIFILKALLLLAALMLIMCVIIFVLLSAVNIDSVLLLVSFFLAFSLGFALIGYTFIFFTGEVSSWLMKNRLSKYIFQRKEDDEKQLSETSGSLPWSNKRRERKKLLVKIVGVLIALINSYIFIGTLVALIKTPI